VVTVQRGVDPRGFTLVAFGGAGPMHATGVADTFGITTIVVPWAAGVASAVGLVEADLGIERIRTHLADVDGLRAADLESLYRTLEGECRAELGEGAIELVRAADCRFRGQAHQLPVVVDDLGQLASAFRAAYARAYGIDVGGPVELVNVRVRATRRTERPQPVPQAVDPSALATPIGERTARFGTEDISTPVLWWPDLRPGATVEGPALIEAGDTTVVVPPGRLATLDGWRGLQLR